MEAAITIRMPDSKPEATEVLTLADRAQAIEVTNRHQHEAALLAISDITSREKAVRILFQDAKKAAHEAHKSVCQAESRLLDPLSQAKRIINDKCTVYEREERRRAREEELRLQAIADKEADERRLAEAIEAEERGEVELAAEILDEPELAPVVAVRPQVAKVAGVVSRETWRAEVTDKLALVQYVAAHPEWLALIDPSMPALNGLARSQRGALKIPGVAAKSEISRAVASR